MITTTTTTTTTAATASKRKRSKQDNAKKPSTLRQRNDTFWVMGNEESALYFDKIFSGHSSNHYLDQKALTKLDGNGTPQNCWRVFSHKTKKPADSLLSTASYRLSYVWSVLVKPELWGEGIDVEQLRASLDRIKTKTRDHTCHRCGIDWCCNPLHLRVDSRVENEADKHYHYFLNNADPQVGLCFREAFSDLMLKRGVW